MNIHQKLGLEGLEKKRHLEAFPSHIVRAMRMHKNTISPPESEAYVSSRLKARQSTHGLLWSRSILAHILGTGLAGSEKKEIGRIFFFHIVQTTIRIKENTISPPEGKPYALSRLKANRSGWGCGKVLLGCALGLASLGIAKGATPIPDSTLQAMVQGAQDNEAHFKASQGYQDIVQASKVQASTLKPYVSLGKTPPPASYQSVVNTLGLNTQANNGASNGPTNPKVATGAIEFVSLSMPVASLRQILTDAARYNIPVVIRGLLQNNWKLTTSVITSILQPSGMPPIQGSFEIDPVWFRTFGISEAPALVVVDPNNACTTPTCTPSFDVVYGNISIQNALELIRNKGTVGQSLAAEYLGGQS